MVQWLHTFIATNAGLFFVKRNVNQCFPFQQQLQINQDLAEEDLWSPQVLHHGTAAAPATFTFVGANVLQPLHLNKSDRVNRSKRISVRSRVKAAHCEAALCLCPPCGETRRWWNLLLSPPIIRAVLLDKWSTRSARCPPTSLTDWRRRRLYKSLASWHWGQQVSAHWAQSTPRLNATLRFLFWWGLWAERFNGNMEP